MCIVETRTRRFPANPQGLTEYHTTLQVQDESLSFEHQLDAILEAYSAETAGKEVLLQEAGAGFKDIAYSIVYLRDAADYLCVRSLLQRSCPSLAPIYVLAPVCRPAWLVEMECLAVTRDGNPSFNSF